MLQEKKREEIWWKHTLTHGAYLACNKRWMIHWKVYFSFHCVFKGYFNGICAESRENGKQGETGQWHVTVVPGQSWTAKCHGNMGHATAYTRTPWPSKRSLKSPSVTFFPTRFFIFSLFTKYLLAALTHPQHTYVKHLYTSIDKFNMQFICKWTTCN